MDREFLVTEAARRTGCSTVTFSRYASRGLIPFREVAGVKVFDDASVRAAKALYGRSRQGRAA